MFSLSLVFTTRSTPAMLPSTLMMCTISEVFTNQKYKVEMSSHFGPPPLFMRTLSKVCTSL